MPRILFGARCYGIDVPSNNFEVTVFKLFKMNLAKTLLLCSVISISSLAHTEEEIRVFGTDGSNVMSSLKYSYFSIGGLTSDQIEKGGGSFSNYNYIGINYKVSDDRKVALRLPFYFNTAGFDKYGANQVQKIELADVVLASTFYDLGYIGPVDFSGTVKLGLPTSNYSQMNKMIAFLSMDLFADYTPARYTTLTYLLKPRVYLQSQKAFFDSTTPLRADGAYVTDPRRTNKIADFEQSLQITRDLSSKYAIRARVGTDETWYYGSDSEALNESHVTSGIAGLAVSASLSRTWMMQVGVENKPKLMPYRNKKTNEVLEEVAFFRPKDNSYTLQLNGVLF